jgi:hypothetical protein
LIQAGGDEADTVVVSAHHVYASCYIHPTGRRHLNVGIIGVPKTMIAESRQDPMFKDCDDREIVQRLFEERIVPVLYPDPGATCRVGCTLFAENDPPSPQLLAYPENQEIEGIRSWRLHVWQKFEGAKSP